MKSIFIGPGDFRCNIEGMFVAEGWEVTKNWREATALCLPGGADVNPKLYGEANTASSYDDTRDAICEVLFGKFSDRPKIGICGGGQILNVLSGGKMFQHVDGHEYGGHPLSTKDGEVYVNTMHHQAMNPKGNYVPLGVSHDGLQEALFYPGTQSLCFQPHPELGPASCRDLFFKLLQETLSL